MTDATQATRDRFGRLLAYVYKPGRAGPLGSVNYALVNSGRAKVYVFNAILFTHARAFLQAQKRARRVKAGLWGPPCGGNTTKRDPSAPAPTPPTPTPPTPTPPVPAPPAPTGPCDPNYAGACIPVYPPDVDCGQITARNFQVVGTDVHNFDVDNDRIACEE